MAVITTSSTPPSMSPLMELPGELRNHIFELALYHEDEGVIAPMPEHHTSKIATAFKAGERHACTSDAGIDYCKYKHLLLQRPGILTDEEEYDKETLRVWMLHPSGMPKSLRKIVDERRGNLHLCQLDCLVQPPLTRCSRQGRDESLPIFYHINKFHLEMHHEDSEHRMLTDWWRATGDTNIRTISDVSLVFDQAPNDRPMVLRVLRGVVTVENERMSVPKAEATLTDRRTRREPRTSPSEAEMTLNQFRDKIQTLEEKGLHVRALECAVEAAGFGNCLRDESVLDRYWDGIQQEDKFKPVSDLGLNPEGWN